MSRRRQASSRAHSILQRIASVLLILLIGTGGITTALAGSIIKGLLPAALTLALLFYGFSSSFLLFVVMVVAVTVNALILGFIPVLGPGLYWFVFKDFWVLRFQEAGLEPNLLIMLVIWVGLFTSLVVNIHSLIYCIAALSGGRLSVNESEQRPRKRQSYMEETITREAFEGASKAFCSRHMPILFTNWNKADLRAIEFGNSEATRYTRTTSSSKFIRDSGQQLRETLRLFDSYSNRLGHVKFDKKEPCIELVKEDNCRFIKGIEAYAMKLTYTVTFERALDDAVIQKSVLVEVSTIRQNVSIRLLSLVLVC